MNDKDLENMWDELHEIEFIGSGQLPYKWHSFPEGTDIVEIERWFDTEYSKGVAGLRRLDYLVK